MIRNSRMDCVRKLCHLNAYAWDNLFFVVLESWRRRPVEVMAHQWKSIHTADGKNFGCVDLMDTRNVNLHSAEVSGESTEPVTDEAVAFRRSVKECGNDVAREEALSCTPPLRQPSEIRKFLTLTQIVPKTKT